MTDVFLMALRRQPVTGEERAETQLHRGFPQWDSKKRRVLEVICPSREEIWLQKGRQRSAHTALRCVLLPASKILQDPINLVFLADSLKERQQVQQFCVIHIVKPGLNWNLEIQTNSRLKKKLQFFLMRLMKAALTYSIFWMENIRGWWIVNNNNVVELSPQSTEVFNIVPSVKYAGLSEESCSKHTPLVQQICHRVCILPESNKRKDVTLQANTCPRFTKFQIQHKVDQCIWWIQCQSCKEKHLFSKLMVLLLFKQEAKHIVFHNCLPSKEDVSEN